MYFAYVTTLNNLQKHPNADRLQIGECFGNKVVVSIDYTPNMLGVYFPSDGQLSVEFAEVNNLLRKKDENGNNIGGYMDPDKRNVTAIKLRGEKSDGLFLPLSSLDYCFNDHLKEDNTATMDVAANHLKAGDRVDVVNGHEICCKYIPRKQDRKGSVSAGNRTRKKKVPVAPLFAEHADTEQLAYNLSAFKPGDEIEITLKMHGTSQRTGYLPVLKGYKADFFWDKILKTVDPNKPMGKFTKSLYERAMNHAFPIYDWGYVSGTRRTVLEDFEGGYYGSNEFRESHSKFFEGKLNKGETVYYEVVGFTTNGTPIMASGDNKKLNDKDFVKQYGDTTVFSYGCHPDGVNHLTVDNGEGDPFFDPRPQSDIYVYRMTMTNEDGFVVEYTPDFMRYRCEQMGVKCVPVFARVILPCEEYFDEDHPVGEYVKAMSEQYYDGPDPIGKTHIREGVVVRIINRPKFCAYKHKNWFFKAVEGLVKIEAEAPDMEEAQNDELP